MASLDRFVSGSIIIAKETVYGSKIVWHEGLTAEVDKVQSNELMTVVEDQDEYGWIRVITPRGVIGLIHKTNVREALVKLCKF
jgi:hypothetical protein